MMQNENKTALFLDCSSGLSGDMFVGALLDLGADAQKLVQTLNTLPLDGFSIRISRVNKSALNVCDFDVILDGPEAGLDHNMDYLYGHEHDHAHAEHMHSHEEQGNEPGHSHTEHTHEHVHSHTEHTHENVHSHAEHTHENVHSHAEHVHRSLEDITRILKGGALSENALGTALKVFTIVAQAEAHVHGKTVEEVHFHEVGAVDSIVDIAAAAICLDDLHIDRVVLTHLTDGTGKRLSTMSFVLIVERVPYGSHIDSINEYTTFQEAMDAVTEAAESAAEDAADIREIYQYVIDSDAASLRAELMAGTEETAGLHLGFYKDADGNICQVDE